MVQPTDMIPNEPPKEEAKHKAGLFGSAPKQEGSDTSILLAEVANASRRMRTLEERTANMVRKSQITEQNMLNNNKKVANEIKTLNDDIKELKKSIAEITDHLHQIVEELKRCAKKEEIKVVQKYVDMWEPIKFVTRNEVERIINDILQK